MANKRSAPLLPFNPDIFRWARNRAGYTPSEVAKKIHAKPQQIIDWENFTSSPTVNQARRMADF